MTDAVEGEVIPKGDVIPTDQLDADAVELGRTERRGRPTDMTPDTVTKLIAAFNNGFNITEACYYAGIARVTYYRWLGDDAQFSYKMSEAQSAPNRKAKAVVIDAINQGDPQVALRYLTLRDPDFMPKAEVYNNPEQAETREKIKDFLDDTSDYNDAGGQPPAADSPKAGSEVAQPPTDIS